MRNPVLAVLLVSSFVVPAAAQDVPGTERTAWHVRVLDGTTHGPVEAAAVKVEGVRIAALTDSLGRAAVASLRPGTYRVVVSRIGYFELAQEVEIADGAPPTVLHLPPQPFMLQQITAAVDAFESRRRSIGYASRVAARRDLVHSAAPTAGDFISHRLNFAPARCPGLTFDLCVRVRGRTRAVRVYVDDALIPGGWGVLDHYSPHELYRVEVYPTLAMVRLYTPWYVEKLAQAQRPPRTIPQQ